MTSPELILEKGTGPTIIEFGPVPFMNEFEPNKVERYVGVDFRRPTKNEMIYGEHLATEPATNAPPSTVAVASLSDSQFLTDTSFDNSADVVTIFNVFSRLHHTEAMKSFLPNESVLEKMWDKLHRILKKQGVVMIGEWYTPADVAELKRIDFEKFGFEVEIIGAKTSLPALENALSVLHLKRNAIQKIVTRWTQKLQEAAQERTLHDRFRLRKYNDEHTPFLILLKKIK